MVAPVSQKKLLQKTFANYCKSLFYGLHFYIFHANLYRNMKKPEKRNILVSVPVPLLKKLDSAARAQRRSRTAEVCVRLEQSLKPIPLKTEAVPETPLLSMR